MQYNINKLNDKLTNFSITLTEKQLQQFLIYYEMLIEKNKVMNLTAITEFEDVLVKHFADSLSLSRVIDLTKNMSLIDLGTGAGFPGIPLKIAFPQLEITLADSLNKRILFLDDVIAELGLTNIRTVHCRAEEYARNKEAREKFDCCVSRAVANLSTLSEYCIPFVKVGGNFISYKSGEVEEELENSKSAFALLGGKIKQVDRFCLGESSRSLVVIEKVKPCPKQYPRKAGTPSKDPIK